MNQKELNELRRRFRLDKNNFSRVYGCYVNSNREIIAWVDTCLLYTSPSPRDTR